MGNKICSCDMKQIEAFGINLSRNKNNNQAEDYSSSNVNTMRDELAIKANNKNMENLEAQKFEEKISKLGKYYSEDDFNILYTNILKKADLKEGLDKQMSSNDNNFLNFNNRNNFVSENTKSNNNEESQAFMDLNNKIFLNNFARAPIELNSENRIFKGEWNSLGQKHGFGILIINKTSLYEGEFENDKATGFGRYIDSEGNYYEGNFYNDLANGLGRLKEKKGYQYSGYWKDDLQEGDGEEIQSDGTFYKGNFKNGEKCGRGKIIWSDKSVYDGDFMNNKITGRGVYTWPDGKCYQGEFHNCKMHGDGIFKWPDGKTYIGKYENDKKTGYGKYYWNDSLYYEGNWTNSKQHGKGIIYDLARDKMIEANFRYGNLIKILKEDKITKLQIPDEVV